MTDDPLDRDLEQMAGSPQLAKAIKQNLQRLSNGAAGPDLAEMARDVLEGRTDLRTVARSSAYAGQITEGINKFNRWQSDLTPDERTQLLEDTRAAIYDEDRITEDPDA
ncbi:MAG TPA: hypothetical protein VGP91_10165 [Actinoplanes sp.]|jgi:hypothetical protein|nr:hypothetical protein [Actinoplanes sp.]